MERRPLKRWGPRVSPLSLFCSRSIASAAVAMATSRSPRSPASPYPFATASLVSRWPGGRLLHPGDAQAEPLEAIRIRALLLLHASAYSSGPDRSSRLGDPRAVRGEQSPALRASRHSFATGRGVAAGCCLLRDAVVVIGSVVLVPPPNARAGADDRSACKQQPAATLRAVAKRSPQSRECWRLHSAHCDHADGRARTIAPGAEGPADALEKQ
jgi:hypothetical protein